MIAFVRNSDRSYRIRKDAGIHSEIDAGYVAFWDKWGLEIPEADEVLTDADLHEFCNWARRQGIDSTATFEPYRVALKMADTDGRV